MPQSNISEMIHTCLFSQIKSLFIPFILNVHFSAMLLLNFYFINFSFKIYGSFPFSTPFKPVPHHVNTKCTYSPTKMIHAYKAVKDDKLPVQRAANIYGVPISTLKDRVHGRVSIDATKSGPAPVLSLYQESQLVEHLKEVAYVGYGYRRKQIIPLATEYAVAAGIRSPESPLGTTWFYNFMARWPELKLVQPSSLDVSRAKCVDEDIVNNYYLKLKEVLEKYDLVNAPERIFNIDEKGLSTNHKIPKVVSCIKLKPQVVVSNRFNVTVIGCGNAIGTQVPPFFVFPGKRMNQDYLNHTSVGTDGTVSESGWSNTEIFKKYLSDHFLKYVQGSSDSYKLVLYDGHKTHLHPDIIQWALKNNIVLFVLPAHSSHILQPLDVGCLAPFKNTFHWKLIHT